MRHDSKLPGVKRFEEAEEIGTNPTANPTMGDIIAESLSRRDLAKGIMAVSAIAAVGAPEALAMEPQVTPYDPAPSFNFKEITAGSDETHHVAEGYNADILIRWGDKVLGSAPDFDPATQTADSQSKQFGYNNDFIGYIPLNTSPINRLIPSSDHGLLVVNHEYTDSALMFPQYGDATKATVDIEMAAHGGSIVEVIRTNGKWSVVPNSRYNRRITATTQIAISGPARGHDKMKTYADPTGTKVFGMLNNCAGGVTPWGTWLTCEENFNGYFTNKAAADASPDAAALKRYGVPGEVYSWGKYYDRFDLGKDINEANRFGWVVEIDPFYPGLPPIKRTALGRFKHEAAGNVVNKDGRLVVYMGDDERFDYVYKFVTSRAVDYGNRAANRDLLDSGTLYVAQYLANGKGRWIPLVFGQGPLKPANGFNNQGDVCIYTRLAADLVGATKMDRPEDIDVNPRTNKIYLALTNNTRRTIDQVDAANPRANNRFGHIIEMIPDQGDHAATTFQWRILVKCGNPANPGIGSSFHPATTVNGWFGMPDNFVVDPKGRLWVATDGNSPSATGRADGLWAMETEGPWRGTSQLFYRVPVGAEMCGPAFTPDLTTLFVAVQHPAEDSTFENPDTRWPDFDAALPPRPSVVAITQKNGRKVGF